MLQDYRDFILKTNTLALAIGVIAGAATSKLVSSIVDDLFMPIISFLLPDGGWTEAQLVLARHINANGVTRVDAIKYGHFVSAIIDFLVVSFVVFFLTRFLGVQKFSTLQTKVCPECLESIPIKAKKCRACCTLLTV